MKYTVYILKSKNDNRLYVGQTNNLTRRLVEHSNNNVSSTRNKGPWEIIYSVELYSRSESMNLGIKLKKWKNPKRILQWIKRETYIGN